MHIQNLKLLNFRNYKNLEIEFSDKLNLIYGNNGMGKTNLVEAIYLLALTKSFRTNNDKIMIYKNQELLKVEGNIFDKTDNNFKIIINNDGKKAKINNTKIAKLSDYISKFNVVLFNPDDLQIIKDSPSIRRKELNMELSQLNNQYLKNLNNYNKLLKQRNSYLKTMYLNKNASVDYLDVLTKELLNYGEKIYNERLRFFNDVNNYLENHYFDITGTNNLKIIYESDYENFNFDKLFKKYKISENKDIILGKTLLGIHHDDFGFYIDSDNLKDFGSEGQQKNAIIAYKMSEIELFLKKNNSYPVLILDDLFSELDNEKIGNIIKILDKNIQTFITTTDISKVNKSLLNNSKKFIVNEGNIEVEKDGK